MVGSTFLGGLLQPKTEAQFFFFAKYPKYKYIQVDRRWKIGTKYNAQQLMWAN